MRKQRQREARKKLKERHVAKERRIRKRRAAKLVDGVDINSLVLIKRDVRYFVTARERVVSPSFLPTINIVTFVKFGNTVEAVGFLFDAEVFGERRLKPEFLTRVFNALKGVEDDEKTGFASAAIDNVETIMTGSAGYREKND